MKVVVIGATGFVGRPMTAELNSCGIETVAVGGPRSVGCDHSVDVGDDRSWKALDFEGGIDAVVHLAGMAHRFEKVTDDEFHRVNVKGVENSCNFAVRQGAKHFLLFSSTLVYGRRSGSVPITEHDECRPSDAYSRSKLEGENAAKRVCESAGIAVTVFRPAPIIGEGSKGNFSRLISAIDNRRFAWVGRGENLKGIVYVGDAAKAARVVLEKGGNGTQTFNIAADAVTMKDIVRSIAQALGRKEASIHFPAGLVRGVVRPAAALLGGRFRRLGATLDTWLGDDVYANEKLQTAYGYAPGTPLDVAIGREVAHYLKRE